ncbi:YitT family protein [Maribacter sp. ACAM166]|uniref:YitT family protein n=1 Tax=Maribacter sp. ACAM166 TaxID=2508996 RepID=UPI0010FF3106|nr:YitT family protein [Maribacter sp. ACAM166]TLP82623.1 YitT family protein [Maribacter sp. ACAM166]
MQPNRIKEQVDYKLLAKDTFFIVTGIFAAAFGLESFLLPNSFIDGGATGISLLIAETADVPLYILIILVNIPFVFLGYKVVGKRFALKTGLAILGLALVLAFVKFPEVTQDKLLVSVFGGFFLGAGIGLSIRGGSVLDGTEVLAIFLSRKLGTTIGDIIILVNILVFSAAAYMLSLETALYSMLTYLSASKTLDFVVEGIEEYTGVTIISDSSEEIRRMIIDKLGRGLTIYKAKGGYGKQGAHTEYDVIYTVITRLEIRRLNIEITKIDPKAFVVMGKINDTRGGMIKKRSL